MRLVSGTTSTPPASAASGPFSAGSTIASAPRSRAASAIASAPLIGRTCPSSASSPASAKRSIPSHSSCPEAHSSAAAIARSIPGPALRMLAGARLTTIRESGNSKPQLTSAARTRSRASLTAASGRPTIVKPGRPRWTSISTRTGPGGEAVEGEGAGGGEHGGHARSEMRASGARKQNLVCR